jgi:hypothetical protein
MPFARFGITNLWADAVYTLTSETYESQFHHPFSKSSTVIGD